MRAPPLNMVLANLAHSRIAHAWSWRVVYSTCRPCITLVDHHSAAVTSRMWVSADVSVKVRCARRIVVGVVTVGCWTGCDVYVVVLGTSWGAETHFER